METAHLQEKRPVPILPSIKHVVVVMFENRSFDNTLGWLYAGDTPPPQQFLPAANAAPFNGLNPGLWNPSNADFFTGAAPDKVFVTSKAPGMSTPDVDPEEEFNHVSAQIFGGEDEQPSASPAFPMMGFLIDYQQKVNLAQATQIMEPFSPTQLPVLSALARNYAVCDAWFSSVPSQTWPNRSFVHAGTSNGNVNNGQLPNPLSWNVPTIFNVLEGLGIPWKVYSDTEIVPSLTRTIFPLLWDRTLDGNFKGFPEFTADCMAGALPAYTFLEPSFIDKPNDFHPPHNAAAAEQFLAAIWQAVSQSPTWKETLLIISFDEHGGTYDHVLPPFGAACPDAASNPGLEGFTFDRFGVRVPMVVVSPWIKAGTVFRTDTDIPYDHASVLATLRDWLSIPANRMLPSQRVAKAPTLAHVLNLSAARTDLPNISAEPIGILRAFEERVLQKVEDPEMNDLQASLVSGNAVRLQKNPAMVRHRVRTRGDAVDFFKAQGMGHR
jgi:phospholipase C